MMQAVGFHRSTLSRQTAEVVHIRMRGEIPRLCLVEEDVVAVMEKQEEESIKENSKDLDLESKEWKRSRVEWRTKDNEAWGVPTRETVSG